MNPHGDKVSSNWICHQSAGTHRYISIHQQGCGPPPMVDLCQNEDINWFMWLPTAHKGSRGKRCIFVFIFLLHASDARVCSHMFIYITHQPIWPQCYEHNNKTSYWLITEFKELWMYMAGIRKRHVCWTQLKTNCITPPADLSWKPARRCLSWAYTLLKQLSMSALLCGY